MHHFPESITFHNFFLSLIIFAINSQSLEINTRVLGKILKYLKLKLHFAENCNFQVMTLG